MANFDLRTFLTENKLTRASKTLVKEGMQYFHNGSEGNQIINYSDSDITDDLEFLGMGSMDGQDFKVGEKYTIGGQDYTLQADGDELKFVQEVLKEDVIDFTDKEQYAKFLQFGTKELEGKKVKLNIFDTFANDDPEKEKFTGDIIVNLKERTSGYEKLYFNGTLIDDGGYKYIAPLKGKEIQLEIPNTTGGTGYIGDRVNQVDDIRGIFKVKTLEIIG